MKEIKAYVREDKMVDVVRGLRSRGARGITIVRVVPNHGSRTRPESLLVRNGRTVMFQRHAIDAKRVAVIR